MLTTFSRSLLLLASCSLVTLTSTQANAQADTQAAPGRPVPIPSVPPGAVTGHVTCSDTNGPARFASVTLQPVVSSKKVTRRDQPDAPGPREISRIVQTSIDGSFTVPSVPPGNYYVLADAPGYLSPTAVLTREQMDHPTEAQARVMARMLAPVSVASSRTSTAEVRLLRGATIAGTVRFDDGTPFGNAPVELLRKGDDGKWQSFRSHILYGSGGTDETGHFRNSGLPAGEYRVHTNLSLSVTFTDALFGQAQSFYSNSAYNLPVYSPGTTRQNDAQVIKLAEGQSEENVTIEIPLSKLHSISGSLVEEGTGRRINAGKVALFQDDNTQLASTDVSAEDDSFHLPFVPEGTYTLKVSNAQEVTRTVIAAPEGELPPTHTETKPVRTYSDSSQPLVVTTDVQNILISVPATKPSSAPASAP